VTATTAGSAGSGQAPDEPGSGQARTSPWSWGAAAAVAALVLGPALGRGSILTLDAAFVPHIPLPPGIWGLGPELPRRVPLGAALAGASAAVGGPSTGKLLLGLSLVIAFAGAARLCPPGPESGRAVPLVAGLLYALSPLVLTRVGAGQWTAVTAFAVLPWALPALLQPARSLPRTFLWGMALAATGSVGGTLALVVVAVGAVADRSRPSLAGAGAVVLAQVPWVVPGLVVAAGWPRPAGAGVFATRASGLVGALGLLDGHGFWRAPTQVGGDATVGTAVLGLGLLVLAVLGAPSLPGAWRWRAAALAALGWTAALATAVPGVRDGYDALSRTPVGAPFRESQRFLVFTAVWMAPAAAAGARRLARERGRLPPWTVHAAVGLVALVLAADGVWGVGGRLRPVILPPEWGRVRQAIRAAPGTVLALPFHRYLDLPVASNRRVLQPLPDYLGGDVISSSDPELGGAYREGADPREAAVRAVLETQPTDAVDRLAQMGVRWVVVLHAADWEASRWLSHREGVRAVVAGESVDLLEVTGWRAPVLSAGGAPVALDPVVAPLQHLAASGPAVWAHPAARGWLRGTASAGRTPAGLVRLPAGRGPLWFWPSLVVLAADAAAAAAAVAAALALRRRGASG
jgi:hypothetical protein